VGRQLGESRHPWQTGKHAASMAEQQAGIGCWWRWLVLLRRSIAADQRIGEAMLQCLETERYIQSMGMGTGTKACQDLGLDAAHRCGIHATG